jgi:hypothetical protein
MGDRSERGHVITHKLVERDGIFEVWLDQRHIIYTGKTATEAYNWALTGCCELGRVGSVDPACPEAIGLGRVSHALAMANEALAFNLKLTAAENEETRAEARTKVAAIATAIAALARVPD